MSRFSYFDIAEWVIACFCILIAILANTITGKIDIFLAVAGLLSINKITWHWQPYLTLSVVTRGILFFCLLNSSLFFDSGHLFYLSAMFSAGAFFTLIQT